MILRRTNRLVVESIRLFDLYRGSGCRKREKKSCFPSVIARYSKNIDRSGGRVGRVCSLCNGCEDNSAENCATEGHEMTFTKADLADLLFEKVGLNKREAKDMVECFFEEVRKALEAGEGVKLSGFGNFQLRDKPQRPGRNPKTGEEIPITARRVVTFHASQKLKAMVDKNYPWTRVRAATQQA